MPLHPKALLLLGSVLLVVSQPLLVGAQQQPPARTQQPPAQQPPAQQPSVQQPPAQEQRGAPVKIAIFDLEAIKNQGAAFKDLRRQRQELLNSFNAERQKEGDSLRTAEEELSRQRAILSPEAYADERRKLGQRVGDADRRMQIRMHQIDVVSNNAADVIEKALQQLIVDVVQENNISLLFARQSLHVVAQSLDITNDVLAALDKRISTVKVANPNTVKVDVPPNPAAGAAAPPAQAPAARTTPAAPAPAKPAPAPARPAPAR